MTTSIDTSAAAEMLGTMRGRLDQWQYEGKDPPYIKVGRSVRYRPGILQEWLEAQTVTRERRPEGW